MRERARKREKATNAAPKRELSGLRALGPPIPPPPLLLSHTEHTVCLSFVFRPVRRLVAWSFRHFVLPNMADLTALRAAGFIRQRDSFFICIYACICSVRPFCLSTTPLLWEFLLASVSACVWQTVCICVSVLVHFKFVIIKTQWAVICLSPPRHNTHTHIHTYIHT